MSNIEEAKKYKDLGNAAFTAQKYEEALAHFTKAIELNPSDHIFYSNRSGCHASLKDYQAALEDAEKCVSLKPDWGKGYQRKGLAEFYLGDFDKAIETYQKGLQVDPNNQQLKEGLQRAQEEKKSGGAPKMDEMTKQLLGKLMTNPETKNYLNEPDFVQKLMMMQTNPQNATAFMSDPRIQKAIQVMFDLPQDFDMNKAKEEKKGHAHGHEGHSHEGHENCGHSHDNHSEEHSHDHTHHDHHEEHKQEPKQPQKEVSDADKEKNLGNEAYKKKNFDAAINHYDKAIEIDPTEVLYYNNKAACYIEKNDFTKAMEVCDKALEVASESGLKDFTKLAKLYARKASVFAKIGNYDDAIKFYDKSLLENQDQKVKDELRRIQKLKKETEELKYVNPELAEQHNAAAKELFQKGSFPEALREYEEAIRRNPKDAKLYSNKATCLTKLLDLPGALKCIDKCLELDPNFTKAYAKKGNIHYSMKEYHRALETFEKGLKLDPENSECKEGLAKVQMNIYAGNEDKQTSEERARHAMADPEIQAILKNPNIMNILRNLQENPGHPDNLKAMQDPTIATAINKLIASGILKMG